MDRVGRVSRQESLVAQHMPLHVLVSAETWASSSATLLLSLRLLHVFRHLYVHSSVDSSSEPALHCTLLESSQDVAHENKGSGASCQLTL
eukprot:1141740-Pelagomonas_calceolata.AAC.3